MLKLFSYSKNLNCLQYPGKKYNTWIKIAFVLCCFLPLFSSCIDPKSVTYFNNLPAADKLALDSLSLPRPIILINDVLEIRVGGENEKTVQYINQYFGGIAAGSNNGTGLQFTVDIDGNVTLPKIGKIKVAGLTREDAIDTLTGAYKVYLQDPLISVRFSNFKYSVLGEVRAPGTFTSTSEKINIFEALAQAGDITSFGRFENVRIIRDINGKRNIITVNLTDKSILNSEYYYINRYDIIYVQSRNLKAVTDNFSRSATFIATVTSILAIALILFKK